MKTHGLSWSPTWQTWRAMRGRCERPTDVAYASYGGRGIIVCDRWRLFENFLADMGNRPEGTTLDRYPNNDGNYEPGNCRWATPKEQSRNSRTCRILEFNGERLTLPEWAERTGLCDETIRYRIVKYGWSVERALTTPSIRKKAGKKLITMSRNAEKRAAEVGS